MDVTFNRGEVHGLVGANGAGKSTLVRMLAGLEQPDSGQILIRGKSTEISSAVRASGLGFAFIHQELNLVGAFTASQNIMLGSHRGSAIALRRTDGIDPRAREVAHRIGIDFPLDRPVSQLTVHQQWLVSIARALVHDCELIAMDEPTASLDADESARLLKVARDLANQGVAVLFISHRLDEILQICDRVTAFRNGSVSMAITRADITREAIVEAIVGHELVSPRREEAPPSQRGRVVLEVDGLRAGRTLNGASLRLHEGELLGVAGLVGSGRTELARTIFGADGYDTGRMTLFGRDYVPRSIRDAIRNSIAYVSEERRAEALFLDLPITSNLHVATWAKRRFKRLPLISTRKAESDARRICRELGIVVRGGTRKPVGALSGGNQQKVVIGRWLEAQPRVLLLDEPTRGVDIGARAEIYARIRDIARSGMSVIVISSEFEELLECDRVVIMSGGSTKGELSGDEITVKEMLRLCYS
ncbi:sugar ABC transporter ATP-binding protein [Micromonospora fulviviridis]|uniref:sugar ABC transporter ATP-binding protein n=1 Tax=Micromonospora fulviviridis TaxID=47860 RepID=UPI0033E3B3A0